jgi:hypothetical protein
VLRQPVWEVVGGGWRSGYDRPTQACGGLKLKLEGTRRGDRRVRFATVTVADARERKQIALVTDSSGCLRYRLAAGDYRLRLAEGVETAFAVDIGRWTSLARAERHRLRPPVGCGAARKLQDGPQRATATKKSRL